MKPCLYNCLNEAYHDTNLCRNHYRQTRKGEIKKTPCAFTNCEAGVQQRGICARHYAAMKREILKGRYTWEEFEVSGLCMKPTKPSGKEFMENFRKIVAEKVDNKQ